MGKNSVILSKKLSIFTKDYQLLHKITNYYLKDKVKKDKSKNSKLKTKKLKKKFKKKPKKLLFYPEVLPKRDHKILRNIT